MREKFPQENRNNIPPMIFRKVISARLRFSCPQKNEKQVRKTQSQELQWDLLKSMIAFRVAQAQFRTTLSR